MTDPTKSDSAWIRTTSAGLLPYAQGDLTGGTANIGTANWRFENAYLNNVVAREVSIFDIATIGYDESNNFLVLGGEDVNIEESLYVEGAVITDVSFQVLENERGKSTLTESLLEIIGPIKQTLLNQGSLTLKSNDDSHSVLFNETGAIRVQDLSSNLYGTATLYLQPFLNSKVLLTNGIADEAKKLVQVTDAGSVGYTIGSNTQPVYFENGIPVPLNQTIGRDDKPVYLNNGNIVESSYRMALTNPVSTESYSVNDLLSTGIWYVSDTATILGKTFGSLIVNKYNDQWLTEIYQDYYTGQIALRGKNGQSGFTDWRIVLDNANFEEYLNPIYIRADQYSDFLDGDYVTLNTPQTINADKTFAGNIILTEEINYGEELPATGVDGQLFFTPSDGESSTQKSGLVIYRIMEV